MSILSSPRRESPVSPGARLPDAHAAAFAGAVAVHGPADVALTLAAWGLESNPIVVELGAAAWIAIKAILLVAAAWVYFDSQLPTPEPYPYWSIAWLVTLFWIGVALVLPNAAILAGVEVSVGVSL